MRSREGRNERRRCAGSLDGDGGVRRNRGKEDLVRAAVALEQTERAFIVVLEKSSDSLRLIIVDRRDGKACGTYAPVGTAVPARPVDRDSETVWKDAVVEGGEGPAGVERGNATCSTIDVERGRTLRRGTVGSLDAETELRGVEEALASATSTALTSGDAPMGLFVDDRRLRLSSSLGELARSYVNPLRCSGTLEKELAVFRDSDVEGIGRGASIGSPSARIARNH